MKNLQKMSASLFAFLVSFLAFAQEKAVEVTTSTTTTTEEWYTNPLYYYRSSSSYCNYRDCIKKWQQRLIPLILQKAHQKLMSFFIFNHEWFLYFRKIL